ncbi:SWI5-dependent HO expression protein 3 [Nakaseomyces bracarensis]|uniref:SWI5-dependent HO expression protein 3 n=1 Tax=Nakaseomyces bracarensis TaxID=273131 RepID=A0ABR4NY75_9SACH
MVDQLLPADQHIGKGVEGISGNAASSTRLIESLHDQIDALTSTNIDLTSKLQSLLNKLDSIQQKETKLKESTSSLRYERDNVSLMLKRKERKLAEENEAIDTLGVELEKLRAINKELKEKASNVDGVTEETLKNDINTVQSEYDTLISSQGVYQEDYASQIDSLTNKIDQYRVMHKDNIDELETRQAGLTEQLSTLEDSYNETQSKSENFKNQIVKGKLIDTKTQINLIGWLVLFRETKKISDEYYKQSEIPIPDEIRVILNDPILNELDTHYTLDTISYKKTRSKPSQSSPLVGTTRKRFTSPSTSYTPRVSSTQGTLPGVKRTPSLRSGSNVESPRNTTPGSSSRRKRSSMIFK